MQTEIDDCCSSRSRKRRTSETLMDDEETMTECSAAMLLMKLSCSPHSTQFATSLPTFDQFGRPNFPNLPSPVESSGSSSFRSATPSPPLSSSTGTSSTADEGIVKDLYESRSRSNSNKPVWSFSKKNALFVGLGLQSLYRLTCSLGTRESRKCIRRMKLVICRPSFL